MIIDFSKLEETTIDGFKGGAGIMHSRAWFDGHNRIMLNRLEPNACAGLHKHTGNCEMIYVLSGELDFEDNGTMEHCVEGQLHYCPNGHNHSFKNNGTEQAVFLAIVPAQGD